MCRSDRLYTVTLLKFNYFVAKLKPKPFHQLCLDCCMLFFKLQKLNWIFSFLYCRKGSVARL